MNDKEEKLINSYWVRLVIIWVVWLSILSVLGWLIFQELRKPPAVVAPQAPLTEINSSKVEQVEIKLQER